MEELKPCPFCGSHALGIGPQPCEVCGFAYGKIVECWSCGAIVTGDDQDEAITAWNTRV